MDSGNLTTLSLSFSLLGLGLNSKNLKLSQSNKKTDQLLSSIYKIANITKNRDGK